MNVSIDHPTNRPNFCVVTVGDLSVWFSYKTPIAFQMGDAKMIVRKNEWGPTTGKHLAYLNTDKSLRVSGTEFKRLLSRVTPKMATL